MRRRLIYNYWLIIVAWCLFINDLSVLAILFSLTASTAMLLIRHKINFWRMSFVCILSYVVVSFILSYTNISYYFDKLYYFVATICLNLALTNERSYLLKSKYLITLANVMAACIFVLSTIVIILPDSLYTLFTKGSLYMMICTIFLPYLIPIVVCLVYRKISPLTKPSSIKVKKLA